MRLQSLAAASLLLLCSLASAASPHPNVLVIVADDLGWRDLGCTGSTFYESPNIDSLAARGCIFTNNYAACPVCSPTRAAFMTGKYPPRVHITDYIGGPQPDKARTMPGYKNRLLPAPYQEHLALEETTVGEVFKAGGYSTFFAGKWHLGGEPFYPDKQGFDVTFGAGANGSPGGDDGYYAPYHVPNLPGAKPGEHLDIRLATEGAKWLAQQTKSDKPWLCWMSFYDVHIPLEAPMRTVAYFEDKKARTGIVDKYGDEGETKVRLTQANTMYAAMVKTLDNAVGILLQQLKDQHQLDDTIIIFTSDNGGLATHEGMPTANVPLRGGKGWGYEGGLRVPLIAVVPGVTTPASHTDQPSISMDLFATLPAACGFADQTPKNDGLNLLPAMKGDPLQPRNLFWHYPHYGNQGGSPFSSIRSGNDKLIVFHDPKQPPELYDLATDPGETKNLAQTNPDKVAELRELLDAWKKDVGAIDASPQQ